MEDCFKLLHFHLGSQIPNIRIVKQALNEAARVYVELAQATAPACEYMDVGGGLGVDYDGSQTNFESSTNYTLQEYANDVVYHLQIGVRRGRRGASDDRLRERPRGRRVSQPARVQRARRVRLRRRAGARPRDRRHGAAARRSDRHATATSATRNALESYHDAQAGARHGDQPVLGRLSVAGAALPGREPVLGDLREAAEARAADGRSAGGSAGARRGALRHLLLQLLALPVDSRQLGDQAALPDHADPPPQRAADAARRARRHHLRLGRQDRSVHRSPRRQAHAAAARLQRRAVLSRRLPGRRLSGDSRATSTTCSATRTPCT